MQKLLEQYLDSLEKPLSKLTETERHEWRVEAEQHIESLAASHEELGVEREAALEAAIAQFGDAEVIVNHMRGQAAARRFYVTPLQGLAGAFVLQLVVAILGLVGLGIVSVVYIRWDGMSAGAIAFLSGVLLAATPLIGGALLGSRMHRWRLTPGAGSTSKTATAFTCLGIVLAALLTCATDSVLWALADSSRHGAPEIDARSLFVRLSLTIAAAFAGRAYYRTRRRRRLTAVAR